MRQAERGGLGEQWAAQMLEEKGYRVLERNYRCRMGEVDLIARKGQVLAFVEVKLRENAFHGEAREFVTAAKQQRIRVTASWYLAGHPLLQSLQPRFDVVEVYAAQNANMPARLTHLENAFE